LAVVRIEALGRRGEGDGEEEQGKKSTFHRGKVLLPNVGSNLVVLFYQCFVLVVDFGLQGRA
jgi:hypothetical protein